MLRVIGAVTLMLPGAISQAAMAQTLPSCSQLQSMAEAVKGQVPDNAYWEAVEFPVDCEQKRFGTRVFLTPSGVAHLSEAVDGIDAAGLCDIPSNRQIIKAGWTVFIEFYGQSELFFQTSVNTC